MKELKERSVGIVIMVEIENILHAILQKRGSFSIERMKPSFFPGCLQVTCHGKLDEGEDFQEALTRESKEELGKEFVWLCENNYFTVERTVVVKKISTDKKEIITYGTHVPTKYLKDIRLGPDSGGLQFFSKERFEKTVFPITNDMKILGPPDTLSYMFQYEIEAVRKTFEIFQKAKDAHEKGISYFV